MTKGSQLVSERRNNQTGTVIQIIDNRGMGLDFQSSDGKWELACVDHGGLMGFETKASAVSFAPSPLDWCEECMREAGMLRDVECSRAVSAKESR